MDQDLSKWKVERVVDFDDAFNLGACNGLSGCNRRALVDAPSWKGNAAFSSSEYMTRWKPLQASIGAVLQCIKEDVDDWCASVGFLISLTLVRAWKQNKSNRYTPGVMITIGRRLINRPTAL